MDANEFLSEYEEKHDSTYLLDRVYDTFVVYCDEHDISEDDISNEELVEAAELFIQNGLNSVRNTE